VAECFNIGGDEETAHSMGTRTRIARVTRRLGRNGGNADPKSITMIWFRTKVRYREAHDKPRGTLSQGDSWRLPEANVVVRVSSLSNSKPARPSQKSRDGQLGEESDQYHACKVGWTFYFNGGHFQSGTDHFCIEPNIP